jgi:hypothetical protein
MDPVQQFAALSFEVWRQDWEKASRGNSLGPSGYTLHLTEGDNEQYINTHWASLPVQVPSTYERPVGQPKKVTVCRETYMSLIGHHTIGIKFSEDPAEANAALN